MRVAALAAKERAAYAIDGRRHRGKIDDDFVGEAVHLAASFIARQHCDAIAAEWPECVPAHHLWLR